MSSDAQAAAVQQIARPNLTRRHRHLFRSRTPRHRRAGRSCTAQGPIATVHFNTGGFAAEDMAMLGSGLIVQLPDRRLLIGFGLARRSTDGSHDFGSRARVAVILAVASASALHSSERADLHPLRLALLHLRRSSRTALMLARRPGDRRLVPAAARRQPAPRRPRRRPKPRASARKRAPAAKSRRRLASAAAASASSPHCSACHCSSSVAAAQAVVEAERAFGQRQRDQQRAGDGDQRRQPGELEGIARRDRARRAARPSRRAAACG